MNDTVLLLLQIFCSAILIGCVIVGMIALTDEL